MIRSLISRRVLPGLGLAALLSAAPIQAATTTTTFNVTANVLITCVVTASPMAFGTYSGAQLDQSTTINTICTNTTTYDVGLDAGNSGGTVTTRAMTGPSSALLNYGLFTDSGRTLNWGNTVGTDTVPGVGSGTVQVLTVFGRVPASQLARPGNYTDTITVTVTF